MKFRLRQFMNVCQANSLRVWQSIANRSCGPASRRLSRAIATNARCNVIKFVLIDAMLHSAEVGVALLVLR